MPSMEGMECMDPSSSSPSLFTPISFEHELLGQNIFVNEAKQPKIVGSPEEFVHQLYYGNHLDEIVVLKDGVQLLPVAARAAHD